MDMSLQQEATSFDAAGSTGKPCRWQVAGTRR